MYFDKLKKWELSVKKTGLNGLFTTKKFSIPIPGETDLKLDGQLIEPSNGDKDYFFTDSAAKDKQRIVLHFTAGVLTGDLKALTGQIPNRLKTISVPFVMGRDGSIYRPFSSAAWAWHLGGFVKKRAIRVAEQKATIGIEISNIGPLKKKGDVLKTIYKSDYCTLDQTDRYTELAEPYRGYKYWATYTDAQINSLIILLRYLTASYSIPRAFIPEEARYETDVANTLQFKGIVSHVNYRKDKSDLGPAFPWETVIAGVQADTYVSTAPQEPQTRGGDLFTSVLDSEAAMDKDFTPTEAHNYNPATDEMGGPDDWE